MTTRAVGPDELDALLGVLRRERLPAGMTETRRLRHLLSLAPDVTRAGFGHLVACVVARSSAERKACLRVVEQWFDREEARLAPLLEQANAEANHRIASLETRLGQIEAQLGLRK